jgi:predicted AlkP superfamily pyrophosphatase or phosphodiesterase
MRRHNRLGGGTGLAQTLLLACCAACLPAAGANAAPRLVLQITVDALRGDMVQRQEHNMGQDGFRYLLRQGVYYSNANYQHSNTETVVGHSSLATGTTPALHGMVGNVWFDKDAGRLIYNVEDDRYHLLSDNADVDKSSEIDPTQRVALADGRSPRALLTSTFSDELAYATNGQAKIFAVSVKDRGAIPMAGQTGKAFWFSKSGGTFITSNYYYPRYPQWVVEWNNSDPLARYGGQSWELLKPAADYEFAGYDDQAWETNFPGFGRTFPHPWGSREDKYFTTRLTLGPAGDQLTLDFAKALVEHEQLGQDAVPDFLSISFSSNDYVNHVFGPSSLEAEDVLLHLDRTLAELFSYIDESVGLQHTLIVLSADHGAPDAPPYLNARGDQNAHYYDMQQCLEQVAAGLAQGRFGKVQGLLGQYFHPYIYLDQAVISQAQLDSAEVATAVAALAEQCEGVSAAITSADTRYAPLRNPVVESRVWNNYNARRSGDIYLVLDSNVFVNDFDGLVVATTHGSPWNYDTFVPIFFSGPAIGPETVTRPVTPYDIAATLSARLGIKPPSGSVGNPLPEVLEH